MTVLSRGSLLLFASLLIAPLLDSGRFEAAEEGCATSACHAKLTAGKIAHPPAESCDGCHEVAETPHPEKGKKTFRLTAEPPELCSACHDALGTKAHVHPPVKEGACVTCHDPHSSDQPKLLTQPPAELCAACHSDLADFKHPHGPVAAGDCAACHLPHESDHEKLLEKKGADGCVGCHGDLVDQLKKKTVHAALEGGCVSCHDPHGSAHPKLLADEGAKICTACHADVGEKVAKARVPHAPVAGDDGCASCHAPHASDQAALLVKPEKETCLGCHATILPKGATVLHGPITGGQCSPCHDPHGGERANLLVGTFPAERYAPYTDTEYGLCFTCHNRDLVRYPDTSFATGFRDGERNLHYLHVNQAQKGRSCELCHDLHAGKNDLLLADSVPFGKWTLPLKFVKKENGGSCAPGCHQPFEYDRKAPARKP